MTKPEHATSQSAENWLEALHDAIVSARDGEAAATGGPHAAAQEAAVRACLQLVERVRRATVASDPTPSMQALETLGGPLVSDSPKRIGRFEIIRDLGRGGHGIVFLARDPHLDRHVAIKVPRPEMLLTPETRQRFLREAHAAARLSHPHIVAVHEVGDGSPICYIAADYCPGETLHGYLRAHPDAMSPRAAALVCAELALAVQYAHEQGVLHRDLKPSNVLLSPRRQPSHHDQAADFLYEPKLTDFGLARLTEYDAEQTRTGALVGTPAYMSPEQAEGRVHDIGPATDVYGLGSVLYEMLTGRPPFRGMTDVDTLRKVLHEDPTPPRVLQREASRDLEAICLRALEKNPRRRYTSAQAMAHDLTNFLRGLPVDAKSPTRVQRLAKWSRRNPALATVWVLGVLLIGLLVWSNVRISRALQDTEQQAALARANELTARRRAYVADIRTAGEAWANAQPLEARQLLDKYRPQPGEVDLRGMEWRFLSNSLEGSSQVIARQPSKIWSLAASVGGDLCATGDDEGVVRVWQIDPPQLLHELRGHSRDQVDCVAFGRGADRTSLYSAANDGSIRHWDLKTGRTKQVLRGHTGWIGALAVSHNGGYLASGAEDGRVLIWSIADGEIISECTKHDRPVRWVAFSNKRNWLASGSFDNPIHLDDYLNLGVPTISGDSTLEAPRGRDWRVFALRDDPESLIAAGKRPSAWGIDAIAEEAKLQTIPRYATEDIKSLACMDNWLIEGYENPPVIRVRDLNNDYAEVHSFRGHSDAVRCLAPLQRGMFLSGSEDGTVRKWWIDGRGQATQRFLTNSNPYHLQWSGDGRQLLAITTNGTQYIRDNHGAPTTSDFAPELQLGEGTILARDGRVVTIDATGAVRWTKMGDPAGAPLFTVPPGTEWPALDAENRRFACADDMALLVMSAATGERHWQFKHPAAIQQIAFIPGNRVITACQDGAIREFDAARGILLRTVQLHSQSLVFWQVLPNQQRLLTSSQDRTICLLNLDTLELIRRYTYSQGTPKAFLGVDPTRIVVCDWEGISILDRESGQVYLRIPQPLSLSDSQMSPDGRTIATCDGNSVVQIRCE